MPIEPPLRSSAAERNKAPILEVLRRLLPRRATVLEIAAGTGQHAAHFAAAEPGWQWHPTDGDPQALAQIARWCRGLDNVRPPTQLDVRDARWSDAPPEVDAIYCANMLHIAPAAAGQALMHGAARHLAAGGLLIVYGPYLVDGEPLAAGNQAFDADLRARNLAWGLRRLGEVTEWAAHAGLAFRERLTMPANNQILVISRHTGRRQRC